MRSSTAGPRPLDATEVDTLRQLCFSTGLPTRSSVSHPSATVMGSASANCGGDPQTLPGGATGGGVNPPPHRL